MITFRYIRWKNFLSTGNYFSEIKLDSFSNTLIVGQNGSGKSTMLDALCFSLFGKPFRNINKPQLINTINQKDCIVEVAFDTSNKKYRIIRGIKPNIFEIYQDGKLLNQDAASKDYQEFLEKFILKLNYKSFTQIVILGSASFVPFMQLSAADRRSIIEDLLDIQIFSTMNVLVKEKLSTNKETITNKKYSIDLVEQKYEIQKKHIDELRQNNEEKIKEYQEEINTNKETIFSLTADNKSLQEKVEEYETVVGVYEEIQQKVGKLTKLETQIESLISKNSKDIEFFQKHDNCPTCKQTIDSVFKSNEINSLQNKIVDCEKGLNDLEKKVKVEQDRLNKIAKMQKELQQLQVKIATNETSIQEINKYIEKLNKQILQLVDCETVTEKENNILSELEQELSVHKKELEKLLVEKTYFEFANTLLKDTGIKTKIVKQYLPIINKMVNKYLSALDFFVNFNLDESFKETIKSRHRDEFSYDSFSEGEKQRIDMALMLTWRAVAKLKNSANTNLLILDEIFDSSLDSNGTEYLMNILHMLENVNLFVISHKGDILQDKFKNVIKFEKAKNFSSIVK